MNGTLRALALAMALAVATSAEAGGILRFAAVLRGANESPPVAGKARGLLEAELDNEARLLTYTATFSGLSGPVTAAGFRDGATLPGQFTFAAPAGGSSTIEGSVHLTPAQVAEFNNSRFTFQIATSANPNGEIAGKVMRDN